MKIDYQNQYFQMYNQKRKQKNVVGKQFQDQIKEVKNFLADGKSLFERAVYEEDFEQALETFNKGLMKASSIQVSNYLLYYYRGLCYLNLRKFEIAERDFMEALSLTDDKGKIQIFNSLGKCKVQMANDGSTHLQQAKKYYQKAIQCSNNTDGEAYFKLAQIYRRNKSNENIEQAIKCYSESLTYLKANQQYEAYTQRGLCYRQIGEIENSINDFIKACELKKDEASAYFNLGTNYLLNCKYEVALQKFDVAIDLNPNEPQYKNSKGFALYLNGQYQNCLCVYKQTLKLYQDKNMEDAEVGQCLYNLGNAFLHLSRLQESVETFQKALSCRIRQDQKLKIYYSQGLAFEMIKSVSAIQKFKDSLSLIADNKDHHLYLSSLFHLAKNQHQHKKYAEAIRNINKIVEEGCHDKCLYQLRGKVYLDDEKFDLALKDFEMLLSLEPNYPDVYYYLGMSKANLNQIDAAIADFFKAVDLGSKNTSLMNGISYSYLKSRRPDKALVYINIALQKQPKNEQFLIQRSMVYLQLNENRKSITDLDAALLQNSKNPLTYYRKGLSFYKNKQFEQAITDLKLSLKYSPSEQIQHDIYYLIGVSYANKEDYASAIQPFTKAISLKTIPKYYHERAKCYILLEDNKKALEDLNEVISKQPKNAFAYFRRGLTFKALKMYEQSADNFMKARELCPDNPQLMLNVRQIYQIKFRKLCEPGEEE